jgi:hypothetical protein
MVKKCTTEKLGQNKWQFSRKSEKKCKNTILSEIAFLGAF